MDQPALNDRVRTQLEGRGEITSSRVLSGDGHFLDGHLVVAVIEGDLCMEVGRDDWDSALTGNGVRPLLFAELPVPGWIMVESRAVAADEDLARWIESAIVRR